MPAWIKLVILLFAFSLLFGLHLYDKNEAVKVAKTVLVAEMTEKNIRASKELLTASERDIRNKDETINKLRIDLRDANARLLKRPSRKERVSPYIESPCTGRELYREDGQFLRGEATRAQEVVVERDYYYNEYEKARKKLEGIE